MSRGCSDLWGGGAHPPAPPQEIRLCQPHTWNLCDFSDVGWPSCYLLYNILDKDIMRHEEGAYVLEVVMSSGNKRISLYNVIMLDNVILQKM